MPQPVFTLEVVAAKHGDCLLLHFGDPASPRLILVDGGAAGVFNRFLRGRLDELRASRHSDGSALALDLVMISHVDDDHIRGILDLTKRIEDLQDAGRPAPYEIDGMWFNAFDDVVGNVQAAAFRSSPGAAAAASVPGERLHAVGTIASVAQGRALRDRADRLGVNVNGGDTLITGGWTWGMGWGLDFHVVGPSQRRIEEFQKAWDREVRAKGWEVTADLAGVAAFLDTSPYNLASTVVLAELDGKTMLLTGDARGDDVLEGLRESGLLEGNSMKVDVLKVPHHGSDRNVSTAFFRTVLADHYVISGDGRHHNPDVSVLEMIRLARRGAPYRVHLTYRDTIHGHKPDLDAFLNGLSAAEKKKFVFRDPAERSMKIDLGRSIRD